MLPITKPAITSYLHYAHDLSIAQTDPRAEEYLALAFLQLHTKGENTRTMLLVDFYGHDLDYPFCPFLENELLTGDAIAGFGKTPSEIACALIDARRYVRVDLNEFHVPGSVSYGNEGADLSRLPARRRPLHFNLLYRYNAAERTFSTHGFNAQKHYADRKIGFDDFDRAYYGNEVGMRAIRVLPPGPDIPALYTVDGAVGYLTDFLASRPHFLTRPPMGAREYLKGKFGHRWNLRGYQPLGSTFGMAVYDFAADLVQRCNGKAIDMRPWCLFHDHKRSLLRLYDYLTTRHGMTFDGGTLERLKRLENDFLSLRNYLLEARLADRRVNRAALADTIAKLKAADREAISALIVGMRAGVQRPIGAAAPQGARVAAIA